MHRLSSNHVARNLFNLRPSKGWPKKGGEKNPQKEEGGRKRTTKSHVFPIIFGEHIQQIHHDLRLYVMSVPFPNRKCSQSFFFCLSFESLILFLCIKVVTDLPRTFPNHVKPYLLWCFILNVPLLDFILYAHSQIYPLLLLHLWS